MSVASRASNNLDTDSDGEVRDRLVKNAKLESGSDTGSHGGENQSHRRIVVQILLVILLVLAAASTGMIMGYSAVLLPQLQSPNESLKIDEEMGSWLASINTAATPIGSLLSGILIDHLGRRQTLYVQMVVIVIGWICVVVSQSYAVLLLGRLFGGIATGLGVVAGQVYVAEIADPNMRGVYSSIPFSSIALGILMVYAFGSVMHWRVVAGLSIILPAVSTVMLVFFPESPVWLVRKGHIEKARKACIWFRGNNVAEGQEEVQQLINRVQYENLQRLDSPQSAWGSLCTPQVLKPFVITNTLNLLQALSGVYLLVFYAVDIISQIGDININGFLAAVLTATVRLIFTIIASCLLAVIGRRTIGFYSALGTGISALALGIFLYLKEYANEYLLGTCLLLYVAANTMGLFILPGIMIGELFPTKARGLAGSLTYTIFSIFTFGIAKVFPILKQTLHIHGMFWLFSVASFLATILIYLTLPETKGKTLSDIEDYFSQENIMWITRNRQRNGYRNNETNM